MSNFNLNAFIKELHKSLGEATPLEEIREILDIGEQYGKDSPLSTGKQLVIDEISFNGNKTVDGQTVDFEYTKQTPKGISIWIADNLKGKSSIFKILKYALTGKDSIKPNVKSWLKVLIVNFSISDKRYSAYLDLTGARLKGYLFNGHMNISDPMLETENAVFVANNETQYTDQIQDFFFKQFSYYALKWTSKNPSKTSNDLVENATSWVTYFKSILLESKDSTEIFGNQGKKIFEMLLGLDLTYPINRLTMKKDMLSNQQAKDVTFSKKESQQNNEKRQRLLEEKGIIDQNIEQLSKQQNRTEAVNNLYRQYAVLSEDLNTITERRISIDDKVRKNSLQLNSIRQSADILTQEEKRIEREIGKAERKIIDLQEYVDAGRFFANIDIKHCPSCNHQVSQEAKKNEVTTHRCSLCNEHVDTAASEVDSELYSANIENLKTAIDGYKQLLAAQIPNKRNIRERFDQIKGDNQDLERQKESLPNVEQHGERLEELKAQIAAEQSLAAPDISKKEALITQRAVIEFQLAELESNDSTPLFTTTDNKITILERAIERLKELRFEYSQTVIERLLGLMLTELHQLGLTTINDVQITSNYDIQYNQDGYLLGFNDIAEGEQLRAKLAFYLSLIQLDIEFNFGRHSRFLIIDSPGKEEGDANYLAGLSTILNTMQDRFGTELQIFIGTAERRLENVLINQNVTPVGLFIF